MIPIVGAAAFPSSSCGHIDMGGVRRPEGNTGLTGIDGAEKIARLD